MASSQVRSDVRPHDRFFFSDGSLYILVENTLYCVHKYLFENHATMFPVRGLKTSPDKPYVLGDVNKIDFDRFLASLYPRTLWVEETETTQDWISVLRLASKWGFTSLRSRAIPNIEGTIDSPIDMVTLGRQYDIPAFLLPGYAVLCQSNVPLSPEEGHRLGMDDVLTIYRIRHELHSAGTTHVPLEVAYEKVKEAGLGAKRVDMDARSVTASATENGEESGLASTPLEVTSAEGSEPHMDSRDRLSSDTLVPSSTVLDTNSGPSESDRQGFKLVEMLTDDNFSLVSAELMQWINTKDVQALYQVLQLIVEKASSCYSPHSRLCKRMLKHTQASHCITRLVVEKAMEGDQNYADFCNAIGTDGGVIVTAAGLLFYEHLGKVCQENLEALAASVAMASDHSARVRRLHFIEFIGMLNAWVAPAIEKWVTALLDANDEEKVATLCIMLTRTSHLCPSRYKRHWLERMKNVAQETSKPRVRKLLQGMTLEKDRNSSRWVSAEPDEDCTVQ